MSLSFNRLLACFLFVGCCTIFTSSCVSHKELPVTQILRTDDCLTCTSAMFTDSNDIQLSFLNNTDDTVFMVDDGLLFGYSFREDEIDGTIKLINTSLNKEVTFDAPDRGSLYTSDYIKILPGERINHTESLYWYFPKPLFKKCYHYAIVISSRYLCSDIVVEVK